MDDNQTSMSRASGRPPQARGLYDPSYEHDSCGIGVVADVAGRRSHDTVRDAIQILENLTHRGAAGADPECGDGAGILMQVPDAFIRTRCADLDIRLPAAGQYAVGMVFLPAGRAGGQCMESFERIARKNQCAVLGWRDVPCEHTAAGGRARETCPDIKQIFLDNPRLAPVDFERRLTLVRRMAEKVVEAQGFAGHEMFYIASLSARTLCYKGMLMAHQVVPFYPDLADEDLITAIAVVHQRYSTNTFPSWPLAQPFRMLCHNGEINTLRGNVNKMLARGSSLASDLWGNDILKLLPVIQNEGGSDSACLDNVLELLVLSGRSLAHSILMMMPEAWGEAYYMGHDRRGFYEYHANFMEPWDGPAAVAFTDGVQVGGILDRNGLRPARYTVTKDHRVILASETGVLDIPPSEVAAKGRLQPGKMLLVDTARQHILYNDEVKAEICRRQPYRRWVAANRITFQGFGGVGEITHDPATLLARQLAFGYTREDVEVILRPMAETGAEPIGSMGNDAPLAVLSDKPQLLFNYFKQNFAQVTNPPIDPIREKLVMSLTTFLGREENLLDERPGHARRLKLLGPILTDENLARIGASNVDEFRCETVDITFPASGGWEAMEARIHDLCAEAERHVKSEAAVLVLSDRDVSAERAAIPSLLAVSAVGRHLIRKGLRTRVGLALESGEPREVNHFALLSAYGVDAVN
ncbi:glutamate synthase subunit alpha, partial [bacterium]|nr:glutamate synthase subunit alpha [bacterium]